ncbi:MAG TPA: PD-(D/E)XK nuclease family protein [Candidatus Nanoarchaeia archaeon]|nr:PD-(D/E)XK nuclease family protein [Candidatus Nanoarchaeia archaeon]
MIKTKQLLHKGGFYPYSIHTQRTEKLDNGLSNLKQFLEHVFHACPDQYFNSGPRSSTLKTVLPFDIIEIQGHEVSALAEMGLEENKERVNNNHMRVQLFMLEHDPGTIAMEVPLWMQHHELDNYVDIFKTIEPLTGHVDILRKENEHIWIWDYKPNAKKEKYASTQVYFYALMLSKRTGIPLEHIRCGWFDHKDAFLFKPKTLSIPFNKALHHY